MSDKRYFAYIRVSTQRQGQQGTSLIEQQTAIERYSRTWNLRVTKYYEEQETAAKQGRPVFLDMLKELKKGKAEGLIVHKIDRGARNLKDWADLGALIDAGLEVHFANESLDLTSRGGRLSADIQAVVASDYIRNLREEVKKGFYGRLKQGFYPMPAPIGYLDMGKGEPKQIDTSRTPLIKNAFELYSTGQISLFDLAEKMFELGLRSKNNKKVCKNSLATLLHNPFYSGLIKIKKSGELFVGLHHPIISKALYDKVQAVFAGKYVKQTKNHFFVFRRHISCARCGKILIPEKQKGNVYYRCHTRKCTKGAIREDTIDQEVLRVFEKVKLSQDEYRYVKNAAITETRTASTETTVKTKQLRLQILQIDERLSKLADAYVESIFDQETYIQKKNELLSERQSVRELLSRKLTNHDDTLTKLTAFLELANSAYLSYKIANPQEKRDLVKMMTSNFLAEGKSVSIKLEMPFSLMAERHHVLDGGPHRATTRTLKSLFKKLFQYFSDLDTSKSDDALSQYLTSNNPRKGIRPNDIRLLLERSRSQLSH